MPRRGRKKEDARRSYLKQLSAIIEKFEAEDGQGQRLPLHLSIIERDAIAQGLRQVWLPKDELRKYRQQQKLKHIEVSRKLAKHGVPHGKRTEFVQKVTGYDDNPNALKQFERRARKRRR